MTVDELFTHVQLPVPAFVVRFMSSENRGALGRPVVEPFGEVAAAPPAEEPVRTGMVVVEAGAVDLALDRIGVGPQR